MNSTSTQLKEMQDHLEQFVDSHSISVVISMLSEIAALKAEHVRSNWQDEGLAKVWERMVKALDHAYTPINKVDRMLP